MNDSRAVRAFDIATREELWIGGTRVESRVSHGTAERDGRTIIAVDRHHPDLDDACRAEIDRLRASVTGDARVRLVASARRSRRTTRVEGTVTITIDGVSIVSRDAQPLRAALQIPKHGEWGELPIVWRNGSAAVLLHEAIGHPAEHGSLPVRWPEWLSVRDEPEFDIDDCGRPTRAADLLAEPPASMRRESFRSVPLCRMSTLVARQKGAPFRLPADHVEVHLVAGGSYDPLTDTVTVDIAVSTAGPFRIRRKRAEIAASIVGAAGDPLDYPGVICSREGQELVVGSRAPVMITR